MPQLYRNLSLWFTLLVTAVLFSACAPGFVALATLTPQPAITPTPLPTATIPPAASPAVGGRPERTPLAGGGTEALRARLAEQLGLNLSEVTLVEIEDVIWPDGCLGAAVKGEMCTMALVPGYRIVFATPQGEVEVHTNQEMLFFRLAPLSQGSSSPLITWKRTGGLAGICWEMTIFPNGIYTVMECNQQETLAKGSLSMKDLEKLNTLAGRMTAHEWSPTPIPGSADMFEDSYTWYGKGELSQDIQAQEQLLGYLGELADLLISKSGLR